MTQTTFEQSVPVEDMAKRYSCTRCGIEMNAESAYRRILRGADPKSLQCADCRSLNGRGPDYLADGCKPWKGECDLDTFAPLDDKGRLHMPGERKCGKADCVNRSHIIPLASVPVLTWRPQPKDEGPKPISWEELVAERYQIAYRTGKKRTYSQLLKAVRAEGRS